MMATCLPLNDPRSLKDLPRHRGLTPPANQDAVPTVGRLLIDSEGVL